MVSYPPLPPLRSRLIPLNGVGTASFDCDESLEWEDEIPYLVQRCGVRENRIALTPAQARQYYEFLTARQPTAVASPLSPDRDVPQSQGARW